MQYTTLDIAQIQELADHYGLGEIIAYKILNGGSENTNYLIESKKSRYVLTICEQKTMAEASHLARLLEHLANHGFKSSKIVRSINNKLVYNLDGKPVLLKLFLEGKIEANLSDHLLELIGIEMGKLHKIEVPDYIPQNLNYGREYFHEVAQYDKDSTFHLWLQQKEQQIAPYLNASLPKALIHSDIFYNNVIVSK